MCISQAIEHGLDACANRSVVNAAWWLMEHARHWQARLVEGHERRGDAVEHHHIWPNPLDRPEHTCSINDRQRKWPLGEGHKLQPRGMRRRQFRQPSVEEVAAGQSAGIAQGYEDGL